MNTKRRTKQLTVTTEFTQDKVRQTIWRFQSQESTRTRRNHNEILIFVFKSIPKTNFYLQRMIEKRIFPRKWKIGKVVPILKPGKEDSLLLLPGVELPSWKFWPSRRPLSTSLDPGRRLSSFLSSFGRCPVWCYPPICTWVFLVIFWLEVSN